MIAMPILSTCSLLYISLTSTGSVVLPNAVVTIGLSARDRSAMDLTGLFDLAFEAFVGDCDCLVVARDFPVVDSGWGLGLETKAALASKADAMVGGGKLG